MDRERTSYFDMRLQEQIGSGAHRVMVAVGTAVADRPPHRSRRALLTHRAPPSGSGVETVTWPWMQYPDRREEAVGGAGELLPAHECTLAASFERLEPTPSHLGGLRAHQRGRTRWHECPQRGTKDRFRRCCRSKESGQVVGGQSAGSL